MAEESVRVRLVFEDRCILSKSQKKEGLRRSWVVLNPHNQLTIADFSAHLLCTFDLFDACPHGLSLSMDGFVLPPFESSCILKDKDIVSVKKNKGPLLEIVRAIDTGNASDGIDVEERQYLRPGLQLLANEEFQKETGGYESESEEDEPKEMENELEVGCVPEKKSSKKRKASSESLSSRRKKCKLAATEEIAKEGDSGTSTSKNKKSSVATKRNLVKKRKLSNVERAPEKPRVTQVDEEKNDVTESMSDSKRSSPQEESKGAGDLCQMSGEAKKTPSRSARRKKAKRRWLREKAKLEKQELQQKQLIATHSQKSLSIVSNHVAEERQDAGEEHEQPDEPGDDAGDEVVPVEVRPGHFRFEPLGKVGKDQAVHESQTPRENFLWNGIASKKKGQKWGVEKTASAKRYDQNFSQDLSQPQTAEAGTLATGQMDYEKLTPYIGSPKEGVVVAYRLIELSSSWTPEISTFRVGKITRYESESKKVTLMPIPEFPIEKKMEEDDSSIQTDTSLYKEDGSLEIEFSSLLDVRSFDHGNSNSARPVTAEEDEVVHEPDQTATSVKPGTNNELQAPIKAVAHAVNGTVNAWEEISQAISAKKAELSLDNGWNKKENSSGGSWSYKALRSSALGPVMNYLRSQKEL